MKCIVRSMPNNRLCHTSYIAMCCFVNNLFVGQLIRYAAKLVDATVTYFSKSLIGLRGKRSPAYCTMMRRIFNCVPFYNVFGNARCGFESTCFQVLVFNAFEIPCYYLHVYKLDLHVICTTLISPFSFTPDKRSV